MNIIICDDNRIFIDYLENRIRHYLRKFEHIEYKIFRFIDVEELLKFNINKIDIVFLDVHFQTANGIDIAKVLRTKSNHFVLIFISSFLEYAPSGYQVNALRYILKEQVDLFLDEALQQAIHKLGIYKNTIRLKFIGNTEHVLIHTEDIVYVESKLHEVHFHIVNNNNNKFYMYNKLEDIQSLLPPDEFIRIHQSFLVNFKYFLDAKNYKATLLPDIELPISQKLFSGVKKQLFLFKGRIK